MHRLVVQSLCGVEGPRSRVQSELPQAHWIGAAQQREGQLVLLVSVRGADLHDLAPRRFVFGDVHHVHLLGELRPVVVGVDDADEHLEEEQVQKRRGCFRYEDYEENGVDTFGKIKLSQVNIDHLFHEKKPEDGKYTAVKFNLKGYG